MLRFVVRIFRTTTFTISVVCRKGFSCRLLDATAVGPWTPLLRRWWPVEGPSLARAANDASWATGIHLRASRRGRCLPAVARSCRDDVKGSPCDCGGTLAVFSIAADRNGPTGSTHPWGWPNLTFPSGEREGKASACVHIDIDAASSFGVLDTDLQSLRRRRTAVD